MQSNKSEDFDSPKHFIFVLLLFSLYFSLSLSILLPPFLCDAGYLHKLRILYFTYVFAFVSNSFSCLSVLISYKYFSFFYFTLLYCPKRNTVLFTSMEILFYFHYKRFGIYILLAIKFKPFYFKLI